MEQKAWAEVACPVVARCSPLHSDRQRHRAQVSGRLFAQAGVFPMGQRKIAAYLRVNFSPAFLAQRVGGRPRREALIEGTWCVS